MRVSIVLAVSLSVCACSDDTVIAPRDATVPPRDRGVADQAIADRTAPDLGRPDLARDLALAAEAGLDQTKAWPPPTPYHNGKQCALPACDPKGAEVTDLSGAWTQTITTDSQTCNPLVQSMKPQLQIGHVEKLTGQTIPRAGECVYKEKVGGTIVGVIKGNVMITCEVLPLDTGVTPVVESQVTFTGGVGKGLAWTYLFDLPAIVPPTSCQANGSVELKRE